VVATPNPFNPQTVLHLTAPTSGLQEVRVWDVRGHLVRQLQKEWFSAGSRQLPWDGRSGSGEELASGVYMVTLDLDGTRSVTRVVLVR
jgi:flagellar hook assembly protein FlgD